MKRRDFFRIMGIASGAAISACSVNDADKKMLPYLVPPEEGIIPGVPRYIRSTCMECPAHCGLNIKIREHQPVKLEGNPDHPINQGALCMRGQAALARLYHPERLKEPLVKDSSGKWSPTSWEEALIRIKAALTTTRSRDMIYLGARVTGSLGVLIDDFCRRKGLERFKEVEILNLAPVRQANDWLFGTPLVPHYHIPAADFLLTVGADIFETFISPVEFARGVEEAREKNAMTWYHAEPYTSITGAASGQRLEIRPGGEAFLLIYLLHNTTQRNPLPETFLAQMPEYSVEQTASYTGLKQETIREIADKLERAANPLVICGGAALAIPGALTTAIYTSLLQWTLGMVNRTVLFTEPENYDSTGSAADWLEPEATRRMENAGVLFMSRLYAPQVFSEWSEALSKGAYKIALSDRRTRFTEMSDIILPLSDPLESWGDAEPRKGLKSLIQPALAPRFNTRTEGDILLALLEEPKSYRDYLAEQWRGADESWIEKGFRREATPISAPVLKSGLTPPAPTPPENREMVFIAPSLRTFDGRSADLPLLHEIPDPLSTLSYGYGLIISPETAAARKLVTGDMLSLKSGWGSVDVPAIILPGFPQKTFVLPLDALKSINPPFDKTGGNFILGWDNVRLTPLGKRIKPAILAGARETGNRGILPRLERDNHEHDEHGQHVPSGDSHASGAAAHSKHTLYPPHEHKDYRWALVVDLDRCNGCSACMAACHIENNIPMTGEQEHLRGREMAWLRMEVYYNDPAKPEFIPMMCQQCDAAPCETVCPVYATYHNPEGLNAQIYNRCVGTRYCANNCPYKARRFNWFDGEERLPLFSASNPDLSIRPKGVMEKCTFCMQRIRFAKDQAKDQGRKVKDGEVTTACAQTCPTGAITFGNILDPHSRVSRLIKTDGIFRVLESLGAEPAVYYLSRRNAGKKS